MEKHRLTDIRIRDPFFLRQENCYYLYGTTDYNNWSGPGVGFDYYKTDDLEWFEGPFPAFRPDPAFWADRNFWAPEVWKYRNEFYMIASFKAEGRCRGVQVLKSECPTGPFIPILNKPVTPPEWECLDGTLVFEQGKVYLVFCHEWIQTVDGEICVLELSEDLRYPKGEPKVLFKASEAEWTVVHEEFGHRGYVTDGPYVMPDEAGGFHMLWSSFGRAGYAIGMSHTSEGLMDGWIHDKVPVMAHDGGHGMVFEGLHGEKLLAIHTPNQWMEERVRMIELSDYCKEIRGGMV